MLIANNLCKVYQLKERKGLFGPKTLKEIMAVNDVSLEIKPGQIIGLLGINGAGKTTTIKMLSALLEPTSGSFSINGIDGIRYPQEIKRIVNVITGGERNIYWRLTARENLEYFASLYNLPRHKLNDSIDELLELVDLKEAADMPVERYSKGMKQRLQIARGLVNDPKFLFLDEPTLGLDVAIAKELRNHVRHLAEKRNKGILLTTHYITEAEELCDWIYVIDKGCIIATGTPSELAYSTKMNTNILVSIPELTSGVKKEIYEIAKVHQAKIEFQENTTDVSVSISAQENLTGQLAHILTSNGLPILHLKIIEPRLEDALIQLSYGGDSIERNISNCESRSYKATS
ncbi:MAG: Efflux ABC transporter, ATP-binding protein [Firmicutes bacterium]|nr:Efflux ABC transporter, ATP-binding protein [Bacillota bacterium]